LLFLRFRLLFLDFLSVFLTSLEHGWRDVYFESEVDQLDHGRHNFLSSCIKDRVGEVAVQLDHYSHKKWEVVVGLLVGDVERMEKAIWR